MHEANTATRRRTVALVSGTRCRSVEDDLVVEEPLEVWVDEVPYAVLMRLPGDDLDLVRGFCVTEGVVGDPAELASVQPAGPEHPNRVLVSLQRGAAAPERSGAGGDASPPVGHALFSRSSCGLCGRQHIEAVRRALPAVRRRVQLSCDAVQALRQDFEATQRLFPETGGTHGAALYDAAGVRIAAAEDIGRHNALDKVVGAALRQERLGQAAVAVASSRLSFEMVQKAAAAGLELLAGVSAATSLAVDLAEAVGLTLVGFLRDDRMNIYTHPERLRLLP